MKTTASNGAAPGATKPIAHYRGRHNENHRGTPNSADSAPDTEKLGPFPINTVQLMDCISGMRTLPDNSVDIVIADPPYNASKGNSWTWDSSESLPGFGGDWSKIMAKWDDMPLAEYTAMTKAWLEQVKRVTRPTGSIWVHGTYHNAGIINFFMQILQIEIINEVVWYKRNSFPNLSGRRLTASHETIIWAHSGTGERNYHFDYEAAKAIGDPEGLNKAGKQLRTVWDIPNNKSRQELAHGKHPAQKPLRLLRRMLEISARPGDTVLAPFTGSGSECVAAQEMGMKFLGFENDASYVELSRRRLGTVQPSLYHGAADAKNPENTAIPTYASTPKTEQRAVPPLIKWTGSKRSTARTIASYAPPHRRYLEPFLGGGSLLYLMAGPRTVATDIYDPLIQLWLLIRDNPDEVITDYTRQWQSLQADLPDYYYNVRERFNQDPNPLDLNFLTRTCVNGIIRFNKNGEFNNSFHLSRKGMQPQRFTSVVNKWHRVIQNVDFRCSDYQDTLSRADEHDFVYLDPPYAGNRMRYTANLELDRFFQQLEDLNQRNVKWALSFDGHRGNSEVANTIPPELYRRGLLIKSGNSPTGTVLNGPVEAVHEALYMNY